MEMTTTVLAYDADVTVTKKGRYFLGKGNSLASDPSFALRYVCIVWVVFWSIDLALSHSLPSLARPWGLLDGLDLLAVLLAAGVAAATFARVDRRKLLDLGLVFEVVGALVISLGDLTSQVNEKMPVLGVSWVCLWVALYPMFVPATFGKSVLASLLAASTGPLVYVLSLAHGDARLPSEKLLELYLPNYLAAGISFFPIYIMTRVAKDLARAQKMGSYKLLSRLGAGGMGEVWEARHDLLARSAAIKMIKPDSLASHDAARVESDITRFQREAQTTAGLRSPHTISLYDFGVTPNRTFYYVMELLSGIDMSSLVERYGPVPAERAVFLLRQACHSLREAHRAGLVHRDIKPANLFVCRLGLDFDFVKVLDFGLVRRINVESKDARLTADGMITGSPAFIAPETVVGEEEIDGRVDIYALGCVAYWLVTGKLVFDVTNAMTLLLNHLQTAPVPPSRRTELPIPPALETLILKCLAKKREDRYPDVNELDRALAEVPVPQPWTPERAERWWQTNLPAVARGPASSGAAVE